MSRLKTVWQRGFALLMALALALAGACVARADGDIVYSARYYAPPGSKLHTHFHLYRINPNGAGRRQITFGNMDDTCPMWSPDGRWIAFIRSDRSLFVVRAGGGEPRRLPVNPAIDFSDYCRLKWLPNSRKLVVTTNDFAGHARASFINLRGRAGVVMNDVLGYQISPNGRLAYIERDKQSSYVENIKTSRQIAISRRPVEVGDAVWVNDSSFAVIGSDYNNPVVYLDTLALDGTTRTHVRCQWPDSKTDPYMDSVDPGSRSLQPPPPKSMNEVVYVQDTGTSGTEPDNDYWLAKLKTGEMREICNGQFLTWAPDGRHFCTSPFHNGSPYGKPHAGHQRYLYTAALQIGSLGSDNLNDIVSGMVWVNSADWRQSRRAGRK